MRPSWPPPRMPMVEPGGSAQRLSCILGLRRRSRRRCGLRARGRPRARCRSCASARARICAAEQAGIGRAGLADGERADRHAGRHLHDGKRLSWPPSAVVATGTPSTGSGVSEAVMPGRCAAPPAPAMITLRPRALRRLGVLVEPLRRAVGGDDVGLVGNASSSSTSAACFMRRPVGLAAHDDADDGFPGAHFLLRLCFGGAERKRGITGADRPLQVVCGHAAERGMGSACQAMMSGSS